MFFFSFLFSLLVYIYFFNMKPFSEVAPRLLVQDPNPSSVCKIWLDLARFGLCKVWVVQGLDHARFGLCKVWNIQGLERARFGPCEVWIVHGLDPARFGSCKILTMWDLERSRFDPKWPLTCMQVAYNPKKPRGGGTTHRSGDCLLFLNRASF